MSCCDKSKRTERKNNSPTIDNLNKKSWPLGKPSTTNESRRYGHFHLTPTHVSQCIPNICYLFDTSNIFSSKIWHKKRVNCDTTDFATKQRKLRHNWFWWCWRWATGGGDFDGGGGGRVWLWWCFGAPLLVVPPPPTTKITVIWGTFWHQPENVDTCTACGAGDK